MLSLIGVNLLAAVAFAGVYATGAGGRLSPGLSLLVLGVTFGGLTALWARVERRLPGARPIRRLGRGLISLLAIVVGLPSLVLMPLFWLEKQLPSEAVAELHLGPTMVLLLAGLVLLVSMNVAGGLVAVAMNLRRRWRAGGRSETLTSGH